MQQRRNHVDWTLFAALSVLWASAYAFTRMAVSRDAPDLGLPPEIIIAGRLTLGGLVLLIAALMSGQKWPPLREYRSWGSMVLMGIIGTAAPFYVITTAQQTVNSSLAALYVAAAPLFVAVLAHFIFSDDRLTPRKLIGLIIGFSGVAVLFGPEALQDFGSASVAAQALCLVATMFYAVATITARTARNIPPLVFSASFVGIGALATWPLLPFVDMASLKPSTGALIGDDCVHLFSCTEDGIYRAGFLAKSAEDALGQIDVILGGSS